jgi:geranylgeranyl diphosphate synthase type II
VNPSKFSKIRDYAALVDSWLKELPVRGSGDFGQALSYAYSTPGKRFRPSAMLLTAEILGIKSNKIKDLALAIELLHCSSLVHDDLPALDNDSFRRGRETVHVKYGEATAILAGDALISDSFGILAAAEVPHKLLSSFSDTFRLLCEGQVLDLDISINSWERVEERHQKKTGAMIELALSAPAYLLPSGEERIQQLKSFGKKLGVIFQLVDDIRDVTKSSEVLGKTSDLDKKLGRVTAISFLGLDGATARLKEIEKEVREELVKSDLSPLEILVDYLMVRLEE